MDAVSYTHLYLRFPEGRIFYPLLAALIVWVIGLTIYRDPEGNRIDRVAGSFEFILLTSSYASINLTHTYINLTGPFAIVLAYYALARFYGVATRRVLETSALRDSTEREEELGAFLLLLRVENSNQRAMMRIIRTVSYTHLDVYKRQRLGWQIVDGQHRYAELVTHAT